MYQTGGMHAAPDNRLYRTSHGDRLLTGTILALATGVLLVMANHRKVEGTSALLHVANAEPQIVDLSFDQSITHRAVGHAAQLEVHDGRIRVREIACPQKLCQHRGWISRPGEMIVCVPNSILIEIAESATRPTYDAVSH